MTETERQRAIEAGFSDTELESAAPTQTPKFDVTGERAVKAQRMIDAGFTEDEIAQEMVKPKPQPQPAKSLGDVIKSVHSAGPSNEVAPSDLSQVVPALKLAGATVAALPAYAAAGVAGLAKTITSGLEAGTQTINEIAGLPFKILNPHEQEAANLMALPFKGIQYGAKKAEELTGVPYLEPTLETAGTAALLLGGGKITERVTRPIKELPTKVRIGAMEGLLNDFADIGKAHGLSDEAARSAAAGFLNTEAAKVGGWDNISTLKIWAARSRFRDILKNKKWKTVEETVAEEKPAEAGPRFAETGKAEGGVPANVEENLTQINNLIEQTKAAEAAAKAPTEVPAEVKLAETVAERTGALPTAEEMKTAGTYNESMRLLKELEQSLQKGVSGAETIRTDQGGLPQVGEVRGQGAAAGGNDLQQPQEEGTSRYLTEIEQQARAEQQPELGRGGEESGALGKAPLEVAKTPVEFIGMQDNLPGKPALAMVNLPNKSTVVYDPAQHKLTNPEAYQAATSVHPVNEVAQPSAPTTKLYDTRAEAVAVAMETRGAVKRSEGKWYVTSPEEAKAIIQAKKLSPEESRAAEAAVDKALGEEVPILSDRKAILAARRAAAKSEMGQIIVTEEPTKEEMAEPVFVSNDLTRNDNYMTPEETKQQLELMAGRKVTDPNSALARVKVDLNNWYHTGAGDVEKIEGGIAKMAEWAATADIDDKFKDQVADLGKLVLDMKQAKAQPGGFVNLEDPVRAVQELGRYGQHAWESGARTFADWVAKMKEWFGKVWDTIRPYLNLVWDKIVELNQKLGKKGQVTAWHGTMDKIEKFTTEKVGMTNGTAFGWGLYFSEKQGVAKWYAENAARWRGEPPEGTVTIVEAKDPAVKRFIESWIEGDNLEIATGVITSRSSLPDISSKLATEIKHLSLRVDMAVDEDKPFILKKLTKFEKIKAAIDNGEVSLREETVKHPKFVYQVSLHKGKTPDQYDWLDWYEQVTDEQRVKISDQLKKEGKTSLGESIQKPTSQRLSSGLHTLPTGQELYTWLSGQLKSKREASLTLLRAGIDGVVYPTESLSGGAHRRVRKIFSLGGIELGSKASVYLGSFKDPESHIVAALATEHEDLHTRLVQPGLTNSQKEDIEKQIRTIRDLQDNYNEGLSVPLTYETRRTNLPNNYVVFDESAVTIERAVTLDFMGLSQLFDASKWALTKVAQGVAKIRWNRVTIGPTRVNQWKQSWDARKQKSLPKPQDVVLYDEAGKLIKQEPTPQDVFLLKAIFMHTAPALKGIPVANRIARMIRDSELAWRYNTEIGIDFLEGISKPMSKEEITQLTKLGHEMEKADESLRDFLSQMYPQTTAAQLELLVDTAMRNEVAQKPLPASVKQGWQKLQDQYLRPMMHRILDQQRKELRQGLKYGDAIAALNTGMPAQQVISTFGISTSKDLQRFGDEYVEYAKQLAEIEKWPISSYWTHIMQGNLKLTATLKDPVSGHSTTRVVSIANSDKIALAQAKRFLEDHPTTTEVTIESSTFDAEDMPTMVGRKGYWAIKRRAIKMIEDTATGLTKAQAEMAVEQGMKRNFAVNPVKPFAAPLMERKGELPGMDNIFEALDIYNRAVNRWLAYSDTINFMKGIMGDLPPWARRDLEHALKWSKGAYSLTDQIVDGILEKIGEMTHTEIHPHMAGTRALRAVRSAAVNMKLGYRLVTVFYNMAAGYANPWLEYGIGNYRRGVALLMSDEGKALIRENAAFLGGRLIEEMGHVGVWSRGVLGKGAKSWLKPMSLFSKSEAGIREVNFCIAYDWIRRTEPTMGHDAWVDWAKQSLEELQGLGTVAEAPMILRTPGSRTAGLFKNFVVREVEKIGRNGFSAPFWWRYAAFLLATVGPRGIIWILKSLPIIGLLVSALYDEDDALEKIERDIMAKYPRAANGLPGFIGFAAPGPGTWQLPGNFGDFAGAVIKDSVTLIQQITGGAYTGYNKWMAMEHDARNIFPIFRGAMEALEAYRTKGGVVLDTHGNPVFQLTDWPDYLINLTGFRPLKREFESVQHGIGIANQTRKQAALSQLVDGMVEKVNYGRMQDATELGLKYMEIVKKYGPSLTPSGSNIDIEVMQGRLAKSTILRRDKDTIKQMLAGQIDALRAQEQFQQNYGQ